MAKTLYVHPTAGNDNAAGSQQAPLKTITQALKQAPSESEIYLMEGDYNAANGEVFPLTVPSAVKVIGNEADKGSGIVIEGSGEYRSPTFAKQNVTLILSNSTELRGVTVINSASRGVGVWMESSACTVANCTFNNCKRDGIFATGDTNAIIIYNVFIENATNGISLARNTQGEIRGNICCKTGFGIVIGDRAFPNLTDNNIYENFSGIVISEDARPVLRHNLIERNTEVGLTVMSNALPDLGNTNDYGGNIFRLNSKFDIHNTSSHRLLAVGNQIEPGKIKGYVELVYNQFPSQIHTQNSTAIFTPTAVSTSVTTSTPALMSTSIPTYVHKPTHSWRKLSDINNHWASDFIQELCKLEIIAGFPNRTFKPDATITRAQYAAIVTKAFNPDVQRQAVEFKDVSGKFWAYKAVQQAYERKFLSGYPNNTFRPNQNIQRLQIIVSLVTGLGLTTDSVANANVYNDREKIPDYAKEALAVASQKRIVVNFPNPKYLHPNRDVTRAEVAVMVYQALVDADKVEAIDSPYII